MTETFQQMIDQLEANYERQEQFVSNASHELKTHPSQSLIRIQAY